MSDNAKKIIIAVLSIILVAMAVLFYINNKNKSQAIDVLTEEKQALLQDLENLEEEFNVAIAKNTELSSELEIQKNNITKFKDSIKNIKQTNWKLIRFYKNKIKDLTETTDRMMVINDSLVNQNQVLNQENIELAQQKDDLTTNLDQQTKFNDTLVKQNLDLAKKVAIAQVVKVNNFSVTSLDKKRNGTYKETDKARRVTTFKVSFLINENPIAKNRDIVAFVVIKDPAGNVLNRKGKFTATDNSSVFFTDRTVIPYKKEAVSTDIVVDADARLEKGNYIVEVYIDNKKTSTITKVLS